MKIAKRNADLSYKLKIMTKFIEPFLGLNDVDATAVEEVCLHGLSVVLSSVAPVGR